MSNGQEKQLAQLKQAYENGILDQETYQNAVSSIKAKQLAKTDSGAIAQGEGATALAQRAVNVSGSVNGDIITGNVYYGKPTDDPKEALRIYRSVLLQSSGSLPMQGIDRRASDPTSGQNPLGLTHVYIDLDTTTQVKRPSDKQKKSRDRSLQDQKKSKPLPALQAVINNHHLVLLGDPGGGKTTFVRHLAHSLAAHALYPDAGWLESIAGWPPAEANRLPIIVILRDFARGLPKKLPKATPHHLWAFIVAGLKAQNLAFAADAIRQTLQAGNALLLLDGLDEVPTPAQRVFVRAAILAFIQRYPPHNHILTTCRILSYQPPINKGERDLRLPPQIFPSFELAPFDAAKIDRFIEHWYRELARVDASSIQNQDVDGLIGRFQAAIRRPDLWRLAPNPLLLTVMAFVHTHKGRLPDGRALLYAETIDILLWRWEQIKQGGKKASPRLHQLLLEANRADMDLQKVLWQLAFATHREVDGDENNDKLADIGEFALIQALADLKKDEGEPDLTWARKIVTTIKLRAGLLLERAPGLFTFPHRTFQEYMAGAHLSLQPDFAVQGAALAAEGALWREVILLAVGRLIHTSGDTAKPLALVAELCPSEITDDAPSWLKAWLAGDVLLDMGLQRVADSRLGQELRQRVQMRLVQLLTLGKLTPRQRAEAGNVLARIGDPRPELMTIDGMQFCYVPAGPFCPQGFACSWLQKRNGRKRRAAA